MTTREYSHKYGVSIAHLRRACLEGRVKAKKVPCVRGERWEIDDQPWVRRKQLEERDTPEPTMTVDSYALRHGISAKTVRHACQTGTLRHYMVEKGGIWFYAIPEQLWTGRRNPPATKPFRRCKLTGNQIHAARALLVIARVWRPGATLPLEGYRQAYQAIRAGALGHLSTDIILGAHIPTREQPQEVWL